jgi:radical SAM enzyme (rSAM/lipoprotein system)
MNKKDFSFKKRLSLDLFREYRKTEIAIHELQYLFWECTCRCNLECLHCGSDCSSISHIPDMPVSDFLKVTEQVKSKYDPHKIMIVITGGEPLMRKDIETCGKNLAAQGFPWGIVTNGVLLSEQRLKSLINSGLRSVTISLDGLEDSHNWLRNSNSYKSVIKAIKIVSSGESLVFDVVTCLNQRNFSELDMLKELLISMNVKRWRIFTISPIGRAENCPEMIISGDQLKYLMEFIKKTRKGNLITASYECEGFVGKYELDVRDGFFFCRAGINVASVLNDGSISACPNIDHGFAQGNIYSGNFIEIWENRFQTMRNREWMKTGICESCDVFKWCNGNGFHLRKPGTDELLTCQYNLLQQSHPWDNN